MFVYNDQMQSTSMEVKGRYRVEEKFIGGGAERSLENGL